VTLGSCRQDTKRMKQL